MNLVLVGPGRIGQAFAPRLQAAGHNLTILSRREYGDFLDPYYTPDQAVKQVQACDAMILLAGAFQLNAPLEVMGQANVTGPLRVAEALHLRFPKAQVVTFLDARIRRDQASLPEAVRSYVAAKKRLACWTINAARAWGYAAGTRVNGIAPGPVLAPPDPNHSERGGACLTPRPTIDDLYAGLEFLLHTPSVTGQILYIAAGQQILDA